MKIYILFKKNQCMFGVHCELEESLAATFLMTILATLLLSMVYAIRNCTRIDERAIFCVNENFFKPKPSVC